MIGAVPAVQWECSSAAELRLAANAGCEENLVLSPVFIERPQAAAGARMKAS